MPNTDPVVDSAAVLPPSGTARQKARDPGRLHGVELEGRSWPELGEKLSDAGAVAFTDDGRPVAPRRSSDARSQYAEVTGRPLSLPACEEPTLLAGQAHAQRHGLRKIRNQAAGLARGER